MHVFVKREYFGIESFFPSPFQRVWAKSIIFTSTQIYFLVFLFLSFPPFFIHFHKFLLLSQPLFSLKENIFLYIYHYLRIKYPSLQWQSLYTLVNLSEFKIYKTIYFKTQYPPSRIPIIAIQLNFYIFILQSNILCYL